MHLASGEQLGHFKIQSLIGKGGMGEVYRARDAQLQMPRAKRCRSSKSQGSREKLFGSKHRLQSYSVEQRSSGQVTGEIAAVRDVYRIALYL